MKWSGVAPVVALAVLCSMLWASLNLRVAQAQCGPRGPGSCNSLGDQRKSTKTPTATPTAIALLPIVLRTSTASPTGEVTDQIQTFAADTGTAWTPSPTTTPSASPSAGPAIVDTANGPVVTPATSPPQGLPGNVVGIIVAILAVLLIAAGILLAWLYRRNGTKGRSNE